MIPLPSWMPFSLSNLSNNFISPDSIKQSKRTSTMVSADDGDLVSFDEIAKRFNQLNEEVLRLRNQSIAQQALIQEQDGKLKAMEATNQQLRRDLAQEGKYLYRLQQAIAGPGSGSITDAKRPDSIQPSIALLSAQRRKQNKTISELKIAFDKQATELQTKINELTGLNTEMKFDIEYYKCVTSQPKVQAVEKVSTNFPLPQVPFVLVLIDGDAYSFNTRIPDQYPLGTIVHPATRISRNIKNYLHVYINEHGLPPHSKLVVRVFENAAGSRVYRHMASVKKGDRRISYKNDFMLQFTESSPMFDYTDAGTGKERVDGKIHELYHTFVSNPACHKIFLAIATDNGFARMLEQYVDHPTARAKTCIISAGVIAAEIRNLDLETVEWPSVFQTRIEVKSPVAKRKEADREKQQHLQEERAQREKERLIKQLGTKGYELSLRDRGIAEITKELTGGFDNIVPTQEFRDRRRLGIRSIVRPANDSLGGVERSADVRDDNEEAYIEDEID